MEQKIYDFLDQYDNENKLRIILTSKKLNDDQKRFLMYEHYRLHKFISKGGCSEKLKNIIKKNPEYACWLSDMTLEKAYNELQENPNHELKAQYEFIIKKDPTYAFYYSRDIIKGRWIEAELYIKKDPGWAYNYAKYIIKGRWNEAEEYIKKDPHYAYNYANCIIKDENFWDKQNET
jgi:hypothetical protein